jgi:DNA-binding transcriptional LysR family regulator
VLAELSELQATASHSRGICGVLRLEAPVAYGRRVVLPLLSRLAQQHPELGFDIRLSDTFSDLIGGGSDAAVRIGGSHDSRLIARVVGSCELGVFAAPSYLEARGEPQRLEAIAGNECIGYRLANTGRSRPWAFRVDGRTQEILPGFRHLVSDGEGLVAAAIAGLGLIQVPRFMAVQDIPTGRLTEILCAFAPKPLPIAVVFPSRRQLPMRLRVFIDAFQEFASSQAVSRGQA